MRFALTRILTTVLLVCGTAPLVVSGDSMKDERPTGLSGKDLLDFEHLSTGADIYPYEWATHLKSARFKGPDNKPAPFFQDFEQRFGVMRSTQPGDYLIPYVGLVSSWTNEPHTRAATKKSDAAILIRDNSGVKSIKVVGTNCALCHTANMKVGSKSFPIQGGGSRVDSIGYLEDLARSTLTLLAKEDLMEKFLNEFGIEDAHHVAKAQVHYFKSRLADEAHTVRAGEISALVTLFLASKNHTERLFRCKQAIADSLERLLRITYRLDENADIGDMKERFSVLAGFMIGDNPDVDVTYSGAGRFDAFGRLYNRVMNSTQAPLSAPVKYPYVWALKYTALAHYNSNTNSIFMRNIGESYGTGGVVTNTKWDSSVNIQNLDRLEKLIYKIKVPRWESVFAGEPKLRVNDRILARGRVVYENKCMNCHTSNDRVGPLHQLYQYKMFRVDQLGTDPHQAMNTAPYGEAFSLRLRELTLGIRGRFYDLNNTPETTRRDWEARSIRGEEFFRLTFNGQDEKGAYGNNYGQIKPGFAYRARHLSGTWAAAPFLHNGSVPSLYELLKPSKERPKYFNFPVSFDYDPVRLGIISDRGNRSCRKGERICFDTTQKGNSNHGHEGEAYGTNLSEDDKMALLEYLKVLPPEPEYSWK